MGLGSPGPIGRQTRQVLVQELREIRAQLVEIDATGTQHGGGIGIVSEPEQQVLQGRVFVAAFAGER